MLGGAVPTGPPAIGEGAWTRPRSRAARTSGALRRGGRQPCSRRRRSRPGDELRIRTIRGCRVKRRRRTRGRGRSSGRRPSQRAGCAPRRGAARGGRPRERTRVIHSSWPPGDRTVGRPRPAPARGPRFVAGQHSRELTRPRSRESWWRRPRRGDRDAGGVHRRGPAAAAGDAPERSRGRRASRRGGPARAGRLGRRAEVHGVRDAGSKRRPCAVHGAAAPR